MTKTDLTQAFRDRTRFAVGTGWLLVFTLAVLAYWPGLSGPWLFDDFRSLAKLGDFGGVRDWETFKAFVFGGTTGPTGRPLALVTFLIDGQNWPTDAWPFKRTNLVIHLLNSALLGLLISQVLSVLRYERNKIRHIALITAACWLLHPYLVSTTLYVVQRMAQLATMFVFAGLIGFMYGRARLQVRPRLAYVTMSVSLAGFTLLALLAKENGVLLPMLALVLEMTVFSAAALPRLNRWWSIAFMALPSLVILTYLGSRAFDPSFFETVPPRDFSIYERLLTQPRVLVDYLQNWFIPKLYTTGVFQDHFIKSTGLLSPLSTIAAIVFHVALVSFSFVVRRRWPLVALSVLFFYVGHLVESTVVNLELYFEHRNYLPAAMLYLPIVVFLREKLDTKRFFLVGLLVLAILGGFTRYSATVWQDFEVMAATSARKAPNSARAQAYYAANLFNAGQVDASFAVLNRALEAGDTPKPLLLVQRLVLSCHTQRIERQAFERDAGILAGTTYDARLLNMYQQLTDAIVKRNCPVIPDEALLSMFEHMLQTPPNDDTELVPYSQIQYFIGYIRAHLDRPGAAVAAFEASLHSRPDASTAMAMADVLAGNDHKAEALQLSEVALQLLRTADALAPRRMNVTEADVLRFQENLRSADPVPPPADGTVDRAE